MKRRHRLRLALRRLGQDYERKYWGCVEHAPAGRRCSTPSYQPRGWRPVGRRNHSVSRGYPGGYHLRVRRARRGLGHHDRAGGELVLLAFLLVSLLWAMTTNPLWW